MTLLAQIKSPDDLKKTPIEELPRLAEEIRQKITEVVFKNGGHLGSNLGVVELTIALFYVFNLQNDRVIWDVSHQCYTHKILSGRLEKFNTLRLFGGLSGFSAPEESPYDVFMVGHAGTAVSSAVGLACANQLLKNSHKAIAVLGDGALTTGMTFEALNHAGTVKPDVLVILNDNKMSISRTIGAMANYLNKLRMTSLYADVKKDVYKILDRIPVVGQPMEKALDHLRSAAVATMGGFIFEELGFSYYGPQDGHNIPQLIHTLRDIKRFKKPILLHIITEKGKGSDLALTDQCRLHGVSPKKYSEEGKISLEPVTTKTYTEVFSETVTDLAKRDKNVVAITAAMPDGTGLIEFERIHPDRYFDVGICEQHAVGLATGLAKSGLKPVAAIYSTFLQRALDQLFQEVALQTSTSLRGAQPSRSVEPKSPIVFAMDRAGLVGSDGPTHHGVFDITYTRLFPEFIVMAPKDGVELSQMLEFALTLNQPVFIRYPRTKIPEQRTTNDEQQITSNKTPLQLGRFERSEIRLGRAEILKDGKQGVIIAYGSMVYPAYKASEQLAKEGIDIMVVNARFAKPLDKELITRLTQEQPFIITVEEHSLNGGFGSAVLEYVNRRTAPANQIDKNQTKIIRLGIPDKFIEHGSRDKLLASIGLDADGIKRTVKSIIKTVEC